MSGFPGSEEASHKAFIGAFRECSRRDKLRSRGLSLVPPVDKETPQEVIALNEARGVMVECVPLSGRWHKRHCLRARKDMIATGIKNPCKKCDFNNGRFGE